MFASSFELDSAVAVGETFGMSKLAVVDTLSSLCRKSLVQMEDHDGTTRYRYLETMRAFAEELNEEAGELDEAMAGLRAWLLEWVRQFPVLYLGCQIDQAAAMIDSEEANLHRVLDWASDHDDPATIADFFAPFGLFVYWGGDRLALLAAEYVGTAGIDQAPGADSVLALAAFAAYENFDLETGRVLTERGFASAARTGETAFACELSRWTLEFVLAGDPTVRSRTERARADAEARGAELAVAAFDVTLLCHDAFVGSLGLMDSGSEVVRHRAVEFEAPMFEMLAEAFCGVGEKQRDLDQARIHLARAAELDGPSRLFIGNFIRQELASLAILTDDDREATRLGAHLARHAATAGLKNFFVLAAAILTGPFVRSGDGQTAATLAGWASASALFKNLWAQEIAHVTARAQAALSPKRFDRAFTAGRDAPFDDMAGLILDQLATLEALTLR